MVTAHSRHGKGFLAPAQLLHPDMGAAHLPLEAEATQLHLKG